MHRRDADAVHDPNANRVSCRADDMSGSSGLHLKPERESLISMSRRRRFLFSGDFFWMSETNKLSIKPGIGQTVLASHKDFAKVTAIRRRVSVLALLRRGRPPRRSIEYGVLG